MFPTIGASPVHRERDSIRLVQVAAYRIPTGTEISGGAMSSSGALVFWSREARTVMLVRRSGTRVVCQATVRDPIAASFDEGASPPQVVDATSGRIFNVLATGACSAIAELGPGLLGATRLPDSGEWVGLRAQNGRTTLSYARSGKRVDFPVAGVPLGDIENTHITSSSRGVVLSSLQGRRNWILISRTGRVAARGQPSAADAPIGEAKSMRPSQLLGMPTHAIPGGFVQMLVDPRSDMSVMVVYDDVGRVVRRTRLNVSLGILHVRCPVNRVLALRRTDRAELVTYSLHRSDTQTRRYTC